jgi:hypothetical protein
MTQQDRWGMGPYIEAYRIMAEKARYRPAAPSDGLGNITAPVEQLDLEEESQRYARRFYEEEREGRFWLGCPDYHGKKLLVYLVEAARAANGFDFDLAKELIRLAQAECEPLARSRPHLFA